MNRNIFVGLVLAGLTGVGCAEKGQETPAPSAQPSTTGALATTAAETPDQDTLATQAYEQLRQDFAAGRAASLRLPIYSMRPVGDAAAQAQERARFLGLGSGSLMKSEDGAAVTANNWELRVDALSGAELFVNKAR